MAKVIEVSFSEGVTRVITSSLYQHDKGVVLSITGVELPETFEVHFSNKQKEGIASAVTGSNGNVVIPNVYFESGEYIYAWIYVRNDDTSATTEYSIVIPVEERPAIFGGAITIDSIAGYTYDEEQHALVPVSGQ